MCGGSVIDVADERERERGNTYHLDLCSATCSSYNFTLVLTLHQTFRILYNERTLDVESAAAAAETMQTTIPSHGTAKPPNLKRCLMHIIEIINVWIWMREAKSANNKTEKHIALKTLIITMARCGGISFRWLWPHKTEREREIVREMEENAEENCKALKIFCEKYAKQNMIGEFPFLCGRNFSIPIGMGDGKLPRLIRY